MNIPHTPIAIIGMSGLFPEANNLDQFYANLAAGRDSVRTPGRERLLYATQDLYGNYQQLAWLERVDLFDHAFFNISRKEAECMDPAQRLLLILCCQAIEDAGYGLQAFSSSNTAVLLGGGPDPRYGLHIKEFDPAIVTGNLTAMAAGRVSYVFNLNGPAMMIDTACSSSLVAVHQACQLLLTGDADQVLAGGLHILDRFPLKHKMNHLGTQSPDGRSKTFDAAADGTGGGEGGGIVLLKRLDKALEDGDHIHAMILGSAVNHDGRTSNGLTAPSPTAQTAVIKKAWQAAGVPPATISYVEAHGTGTRLGDPIEFKALTDAFQQAGVTAKNSCALSAVKSNIGHLDNAAGIAGLIKAVLSLKFKKLLPSLHFNTPNPFIDFEHSPLYVNTALQDWTPVQGKRRCAVSAFGMSGTNVHLVMEEAPPPQEHPVTPGHCLLKLSAKTIPALQQYIGEVRYHLEALEGTAFFNALYTLNTGRDDHEYRIAFYGEDKGALLSALGEGSSLSIPKYVPQQVVLLLPETGFSQQEINRLAAQYPVFAKAWEEVQAAAAAIAFSKVPPATLYSLAGQYGWYCLLRSMGLEYCSVIATGVGRLTRQLIAGSLSLDQVMTSLAAGTVDTSLDLQKLEQLLAQLAATGPHLLLELGTGGGRLVAGVKALNKLPLLVVGEGASPAAVIAGLYNAGCAISWAHQDAGGQQRVSVPGYPFEKVRCWYREPEQHPEHALGEWLYDLQWTEAAADGEKTATAPAHWLLFMDTLGIGEQLYKQLLQQQHTATRIYNGHAYEKQANGECFTIRFSEAGDYERLLKELPLQPAGIIHMGNCDTDLPGPSGSFNLQILDKGLYAQFLFAAAADALLDKGITYLLVSANACSVSASDRQGAPLKATALGFIRGLQGEYPQLDARALDLSLHNGENTADLAAQIIDELEYKDYRITARRNGGRYIQRLQQAQTGTLSETMEYTGRTYLVTGGLSGIGYEISSWLAGRGAGTLLICGRSPMPDQQKIKALESTGASVVYYGHDLSAASGAAALYDEIKAGGHVLHGIVYSAALPGSKRIAHNTLREFKEVFGSRAIGAMTLLSLSLGEPLDFVVLFSSLAALLPGRPRQADYAAGCVFVSEYGRYLQAQYPFVKVVNWCAWQDTGMLHRLAEDPAKLVRIDRGLHIHTPAGLGVFELMLSASLQQAFVMAHPGLLTREEMIAIRHNTLFSLQETAAKAELPLAAPPVVQQPAAPLPVKEIFAPGLTPTEQALGAIWAEVLKLDKLDREDDFFALGGNSINGFQVVNRIEKDFSIGMEVGDLFEFMNLAELAAHIDKLRAPAVTMVGTAVTITAEDRGQGLPVYEEQDHYIVSHAQKRLWIMDQLGGAREAYNMPAAFLVEGSPDMPLLEQALDRLLDRHESLRTAFISIDGVPRQKMQLPGTLRMQVPLIRLDAAEGLQDQLSAHYRQEAMTPFRLEEAPLIRAKVLQPADEQYLLLITMHHIIADAWSAQVLFRELQQLYITLRQGQQPQWPVLHLQYKDYAILQHTQMKGQELEEHRRYWLQQFDGPLPVLGFPADLGAKVGRQQGGRLELTLGAARTAKLNALAQQQKCTPFMVMLSLIKLLCYKYTGQQDIVIGAPVMERSHAVLAGQIGLYLDVLALRTRFNAAGSFTELLNKVRTTTLEGFRHKYYPFDSLVEDLGLSGGASRFPLFETGFTWDQQTLPAKPSSSALKPQRLPQRSVKTGLWFYGTATATDTTIAVEYDLDLFSEGAVRRLLGHCTHLLDLVLQNPDASLLELPLATPEESRQLLALGEGPAVERNGHTLLSLFAAQESLRPDAIALLYGDTALTYRELDLHSSRLARYMQVHHGVGKGSLVALFSNRSWKTMVAIMAIMKAGAAYVPVDPNDTPMRKAAILRDARPRLLVGEIAQLMELQFEGCDLLATDSDSFEGAELEAVLPLVTAADPAYVIYTSGSTGTPKGVLVEHAGAVNISLDYIARMDAGPEDTISLFFPYHFDASVVMIFMTLLSGGKLLLLEEAAIYQPAYCLQRLEQAGVTIAAFAPAYLRLFDPEALSFLKALASGGEAPHFAHAMELSAQTRYFNAYGPSEASVCAVIQLVGEEDRQRGRILIGSPVENMQVYVLNEQDQLMPQGLAGEICISGPGLAAGYLNNPILTLERFGPHPFLPGQRLYRTGDLGRWNEYGRLEFLGRKDRQVKIRGYRIEPGEVESALLGSPLVKQCTVTPQDDAGGTQLVAYYVSDEDGVSADMLRQFMRLQVPEYMVPAYFIAIPELPLTANGKVDLAALPSLQSRLQQRYIISPRNATEAALLAIWQDVLKKDDISADDNFFGLGGNSLKAIQLIARISSNWGDVLTLKDLFEQASIEAQAVVIDEQQLQEGNGTELHPVEEQDYYPVTSGQKRSWLRGKYEKAYIPFNLTRNFRLYQVNIPALSKAFEALLQRHESLRTSFVQLNGEVVQRVHQCCPAALNIISLADVGPSAILADSMKEEMMRPFDRETPPLVKLNLYCLPQEMYVLQVIVDHIVSDAWSLDILLKELTTLYRSYIVNGVPSLAPLPLQYKDFAIWQRRQFNTRQFKQLRQYWQQQLRNVPAPPDFSVSLPGVSVPLRGRSYRESILEKLPACFHPLTPEQTEGLMGVMSTVRALPGASYIKTLPEGLCARLQDYSKTSNISLFPILLTGMQLLVYRLTQQRQLVIATPVSIRGQESLDGLIGLFLNTLLIVNELNEHETIDRALRSTAQNVISALERREYPFEQLLQTLDLAKDAVSGIYMNLVSFEHTEASLLPAVERELHRKKGVPAFDIDLTFYQHQHAIELTCDYRTEVFTPDAVTQLIDTYLQLLDHMMQYGSEQVSTIGNIAQAITAVKGAAVKEEHRPAAVPRVEEQDYYPVTPGQKGIYLKSAYEKAYVPFNMTRFYRLSHVKRDALERAFVTLLQRHESLRTTFRFVNGDVAQQVHERLEPVVKYMDLTALPDPHAALLANMHQEVLQKFNKAVPPLIKLNLYHLPQDRQVLQLIIDHIISDGWSMDILLSELTSLYRGYSLEMPVILPPLPVHYKDYTIWLRKQQESPAFRAHQQYWFRKLQQPFSPLHFPPGLPGISEPARDGSYRESILGGLQEHFQALTPVQAESLMGMLASVKPLSGASYTRTLPPGLCSDLYAFCLECNASLFTVLVTSVHLLVYHFTGQKQLVIGAPVSVRGPEELNGLIGWFLNTLLIVNELKEHDTVTAAVGATAQQVAEALDNSAYPFERLLRELDIARDSISQVMVHLVSVENMQAEEHKEIKDQHRDTGSPTFDINFTFHQHGPGIELLCDYRKEVFSAGAITLLINKYLQVLEKMLQYPQMPLENFAANSVNSRKRKKRSAGL